MQKIYIYNLKSLALVTRKGACAAGLIFCVEPRQNFVIFFAENESFFAQLASVVAVNVFGQDITSVPGIPGQVEILPNSVSRAFRT